MSKKKINVPAEEPPVVPGVALTQPPAPENDELPSGQIVAVVTVAE